MWIDTKRRKAIIAEAVKNATRPDGTFDGEAYWARAILRATRTPCRALDDFRFQPSAFRNGRRSAELKERSEMDEQDAAAIAAIAVGFIEKLLSKGRRERRKARRTLAAHRFRNVFHPMPVQDEFRGSRLVLVNLIQFCQSLKNKIAQRF